MGHDYCGLSSLLFQESLNFQRGHAAGSGGGDGLAIATVLHISAGEDTGHTGENVVASFDVTIVVGVEQSLKHAGVRNVSDAEKHCAGRVIPNSVGLEVAQFEGGN